ncbi:hypothetical protein NEAUS03_0358 [Nematocida ausubeli]|nr:hypothetical protein NEAUS03_0358 [Nematocida ausubeli]
MDYKKQLQAEYNEWNDKKVKRHQRQIQVKGYTPEQIYNQIENITNIAIKDVEEYLVEYMNKDSLVSEESASEAEDEAESKEASEGTEEEDVSSASDETSESTEEEQEESGADVSCSEEENKLEAVDEEEELSEVESIDPEESGEKESTEHSYSSGELNDIYDYLERDCNESGELMEETALETLKKLGK